MSERPQSFVERIEAKIKSNKLLKQSVGELQEELKDRSEKRKIEDSRRQIVFFMEKIIIPYLEGIANGFNEPLTVGVQRLIKEKKNPFRPQKDWNRTREANISIETFLRSNDPRIMLIKNLAKPFIRASFQSINQQASWIRENILKEEYPALYVAIVETEGGKEWLDQIIEDFFLVIQRYLRS